MKHALRICAVLVGSVVGAASAQVSPVPPAPPASGGLTVVPAETKIGAGRLFDLSAETAGKTVLWRVPECLETKIVDGGRRLVGVVKPGTPAGRVTVLVVAAAGDTPYLAEAVLVIEGGGPVPPNPLPPGPNPPKPPTPEPDGLAADLKKAFDDSPGTAGDKAKTLVNLIDLYRQATALTTDATRSKTAGQLLTILRASSIAIAADSLLPMRRVVASELAKVLPTDPDAALTEINRTAAAGLFTKVILRLEAIK